MRKCGRGFAMRFWIAGLLVMLVGAALWAAEPRKDAVVRPGFARGKVTIGGVQFAGLVGQKERNMATAERLIRQAAARGAQVVVTPEVALSGFVGGPREHAMAEPVPGPATRRFGRLAKELRVFMVNQAAPRQNGHSMVFDFGGKIVQEAGEGEGLLVQELDLDALNKHRAAGIYGFHHRRPELYRILSDPAGQVHPANANLPGK